MMAVLQSTGVPLAWRNCTSDRRRLVRAVGGIGFAAMLILMQLGFREAFLESALTVVHAMKGDLVLISPTRYQVGQSERLPRRRMYQALGVAGVESVAPLYFEWRAGKWKNPATGDNYVIRTIAIDPDRPALQLPGIDENLALLKQQNAALMDAHGRRILGRITPDLESQFAGRRIRIAGTFEMGPDFITDGTLIMSERSYFQFFGDEADPDAIRQEMDMAFVTLAPGADAEKVRAALRAALPDDTNIMTREDLVEIETEFQGSVSPIGPIFGLGAVIGFLVGILITYQILFSEIADRLPQFATLKAMGYQRRYLVGVILRQSIIYGLIGFVPALVITAAAFALVDVVLLIPIRVSLDIFCVTLGMMMVMCTLAGLIASRRALTADPAEVF
jgi:putative ABC transport system permease protein